MFKFIGVIFLLIIASVCDAYDIIYSAREEYYKSQIYVMDEGGTVRLLAQTINENIGYNSLDSTENGDYIVARSHEIGGNYKVTIFNSMGEIKKSLRLSGYMDYPIFSANENGVYFVHSSSGEVSKSVISYWDFNVGSVESVNPKQDTYSNLFLLNENNTLGCLINYKNLALQNLLSNEIKLIYESEGLIYNPVFYNNSRVLLIENVNESYKIIEIDIITDKISNVFTSSREIFFIEKLPTQSSLLVGLAASESSYDTVFYEAQLYNEGVELLNNPIHIVEAPVYLPVAIDRH